MRTVFAATLLAAVVAAQRLTTTDLGNTIVETITIDADGDPTTRILSTLTGTSSTRTSSSTRRATTTATSSLDPVAAIDPSIAESTTTATTTTRTKDSNKGVVGAPTSQAGPMTRTVYWYPNPADPTGSWLSGVWENSFTQPTAATAVVPQGTVENYGSYTASAAANAGSGNANGNGASPAGRAAPFAVVGAVAIGAGVTWFM